MFSKITILLKSRLEIETRIIEEIRKASQGSDIKIISFENIKKSDLDSSNLIITLGGDGTFVKAANLAGDTPILGINAEPNKSEGALTSINITETEKLKEILSGNFRTIHRQRAKVTLNSRVLDELALNEVYIGSLSQFHSSRYKIKFKGNEEEHRSSGVIISTGTGSPAWFYSAGGKIFAHDEEKLGFIVREPYFGKRLFNPKMLSGEIKKGEKITLESEKDFGGILAINDSTFSFNKGDIAEIELSDKPLKVIIPK